MARLPLPSSTAAYADYGLTCSTLFLACMDCEPMLADRFKIPIFSLHGLKTYVG